MRLALNLRRIACSKLLWMLVGLCLLGGRPDTIGRAAAPPGDLYAARSSAPVSSAKPLVVAGWLPPWDWSNAIATVTTNLETVHEFSPFWYELQADGQVKLNADPQMIAEMLGVARRANRAVIPTISNHFDPDRVKPIVTDPLRRTAHVQNLVEEVLKRGYAGIDIDYEGLYGEDRDAFTAFIEELSNALHAEGRLLTIDVQSKTSDSTSRDDLRAFDYAALGTAVDEFRVMTYDWSWPGSAPGPIAPYWWVEDVIEYTKTQVDPAKIMMGAPLYGYEWPAGGRRGWALYWRDVQDLINTYHPTVQWAGIDSSEPIGEHWFTYVSNDDGLQHTVWYADHDSVEATRDLATRLGVKGLAFWALGSEDQENWAVLDQQPCHADVNHDGNVDRRDAAIILRAIKTAPSGGDYDAQLDLNVDGKIDVDDVRQATTAWQLGCQ